MELTIAFASFAALVAAWFIMPGSARVSHAATSMRETVKEAA